MANLLDAIQEHLTPQFLADTGKQLKEEDLSTSKALRGIAATFFAGLLEKSSDTENITRIYHEIAHFPEHLLDKPEELLNEGNLAHKDPKDAAGHLLGRLFGDKVPAIINSIAAFSGAKVSSVSALLGVAGPMVMSLLAHRIQASTLNVSGFVNLLQANHDHVMTAVPAGLGALLGLHTETEAPTSPEPSTGARWVLPLLLLLGLGGGVFLYMRYKMISGVEKDLAPLGAALDTSMNAAKAGMNAAAEAAGAVKAVGEVLAGFSKKLPSGAAVNGNQAGIESQLIAFIEDGNRPVDKTTWFNFDRLLFTLNSSEIDLNTSREQLMNMVEILNAYPKVRLRIGGYTDNTGVESLNQKLSQARAAAVVKFLTEQGIDAARLSAEGYGSQHPVASNDTEEGRAQNRRIAVRVTAK